LFASAFRETPTKEFLRVVRWGKKEFQKEQKNCISFLATRGTQTDKRDDAKL